MPDENTVCITNEIPGVRSCKAAGEHLDACPSLLDRENPERVDCPGCLPRKADHGYLCGSCWLRLVDTVENLTDLVTHLHADEGGAAQDNAGVRARPAGYWPLLAGRVAADEVLVDLVMTVLAHLHDYGRDLPPRLAGRRINGFMPEATIEQVRDEVEGLVDQLQGREYELVQRKTGAEWAVRLSKRAQTTMARFPLHESEHRVPFIRCRACQRVRLVWTPPLMFEDEVRIVCEHCNNVETQEMVEFDIRLIAEHRKGKVQI